MTRELVEPNLHVVLIHVPLGLLIAGTVIEFFAPLFWRRSALRAAGRWMILLGALALVPVAASGLYAVAQQNHRDPSDSSWADIRQASPIQGATWQTMQEHVRFNLAGSAVALFLVVIWLSSSDSTRRMFYPLFMLLLLADVGAIALQEPRSGGEMVFRHGVGVNLTAEADIPLKQRLGDSKAIAESLPPLELHVILAGAAIAAGLAAIGVSMRAAATPKVIDQPYLQQQQQYTDIGYAINPGSRQAPAYGGAAQLHPDSLSAQGLPERTPVGRFWILAALLAICAMLAGWWTLADSSEKWDVKSLWHIVSQNAESHEYRRVVHVAAGGLIVLMMLILALIGRAAGHRFIVGFFALILLAAVAVQGWIGTMMLLDSPWGKEVHALVQFNPLSAEPTTMPSKSLAAPTEASATLPTTGPTTAATVTPATAPTTEKSLDKLEVP